MKTPEEIVNDSGYPLQIRLEEWIDETWSQHKWRVEAREHRWINPETKEGGYIDLILEREGINIKLAIECKRIIGSWIFLLPTVERIDELEVRGLFMDYHRFKFAWKKTGLQPKSSEASFCVMEVDGKKDTRTLEKISGELLLSLEQLALEDTALMKALFGDQSIGPVLYLPVIVTTASLQTMSFNPSDVDLRSGKVTQSKLDPVEFIRFRKNLATNIDYDKPIVQTLRDLNRENDRAVFVVQAESFIHFLTNLRPW